MVHSRGPPSVVELGVGDLLRQGYHGTAQIRVEPRIETEQSLHLPFLLQLDF